MIGHSLDHLPFNTCRPNPATEKVAGFFAEKLAAEMLASTMGLQEELKWDEERNEYVLSDKILTTKNICATGVVLKAGEWTTTIAAAVLIVQ